eukprot:gene5670-9491_t
MQHTENGSLPNVKLELMHETTSNTYLRNTKWSTEFLSNSNPSKNWIFKTPQFKYCKKRKEFFSEEFNDVWYKAPYKYHMIMEAVNIPIDLKASLEVVYEDFSKIDIPEALSLMTQSCFKQGKLCLEPFQFNVCSYKLDGRKFRLQIGIYSNDEVHELNLVSPAFTIKSKKPISKPGSQILKRKKKFDEDINPKISKETFPSPKKLRPENFLLLNSPLILPKKLLPLAPKPDEIFNIKMESHPSNNVLSIMNHEEVTHSTDQYSTQEKTKSPEDETKKVPKYMMKLMRFNDTLATQHFE